MATTVYPPTYGSTLPRKTQEQNDFTLAVLWDLDKGEPTDNVTPKKPLWERMKQKNGGMLARRSPGHGPVEDVIYQTPERVTEFSLSADMPDHEYQTVNGYTQAKYDWILMRQHLAIGDAEWINSRTPDAKIDLIKRKKKLLDTSFENALNDRLWAGATSGSEIVWGLNDIIQFDPSTAPTKGAVGRISPTDFTFWRNRSNNFNAAYKTVVSGGMSSNMLHPTATGLYDLWIDCSDNTAGEAGEPDLLVCNQILFRYLTDLVDSDKRYFVTENRYQLGIPGNAIVFQSAQIIWDNSVPNDPNNSAYGVGYFINTNNIKFVIAEGQDRQWGDMEVIPGKGGKAWPMTTMYSVTCDARNRLGVIYGVQAASVS